jgi:hypothetical protein
MQETAVGRDSGGTGLSAISHHNKVELRIVSTALKKEPEETRPMPEIQYQDANCRVAHCTLPTKVRASLRASMILLVAAMK